MHRLLSPAALAHLRSCSANFETFQRLRHDLVAIADCLVLATHLIQDTLRDLLISLARLQKFLRVFDDSPRRRLLGLISSGFCINILDESSLRLLTAVQMEDNWWRDYHFGVTLVRWITRHSGHLDRPWMTFIRNLTAVASAVALSVCAAMVLLSGFPLFPERVFEVGGVHRIANRFYSARLHCSLRVSELG